MFVRVGVLSVSSIALQQNPAPPRADPVNPAWDSLVLEGFEVVLNLHCVIAAARPFGIHPTRGESMDNMQGGFPRREYGPQLHDSP